MGKRRKSSESKQRRKRYIEDNIQESLFIYNKYSSNDSGNRHKNIVIDARNKSQEEYIEKLQNKTKKVVVAAGPAGTGKTLLGTLVGLKYFMENKYQKIVITRPVKSVDEDIGFLPGSLEEKMAPWIRPVYDILSKYYSDYQIDKMFENNIIEICPLAFMRGRTFENSWIIADEMQNATISQTKMLLTRIGNGSKLVITGDLKQKDIFGKLCGLQDFIRRLCGKTPKTIAVHTFNTVDVERCEVVKDILKLYDE